ncbi:MAG: hypothetical protein AB7I33_14305 [Gemmatimonadales bacterium]
MFIELTDHLRCPEDHEEQFLVLIPGEVAARSVRNGILGCPVCRREYLIRDGVAEFGNAPVPGEGAGAAVDAEAVRAFLGLSGPGGYAALVGTAGAAAPGLNEAVGGVHLVAVNPPPDLAEGPMLSLVRAPMLPLKARSLRGVVLGRGYGAEPAWVSDALRTLLPGLQLAGEGPTPDLAGLEILGEAEGWWVGRKGGRAEGRKAGV